VNAKEGIQSERVNSKPTTNAHGEHNTHGTYKTLKQQLDQKKIILPPLPFYFKWHDC
jgi:hypothetical protein